jgi:hypothetical protein
MNTDQTTQDSGDREAQLVRLWSQLGAAMLQRGLDYARRDDPNAFAVAARMRQAGGKFELRVLLDVELGGTTTKGVIVDQDGEVIADVFTIEAGAGSAKQ